MKKYPAFLLIVSLLLALTGCGKPAGGATSSAASASTAAASAPQETSASSTPQDSKARAEQAAILKEMSEILKVDCSAGSVGQTSDTHEKEDGDGLTFYTVQFPDEQLTSAIKEGENWHSLPLSESLTVLAYGIELTEDEDWNDEDYSGEDDADDSDDVSPEDSDDGEEGDESEDSEVVFEEDKDMEVDPPIFEEKPDADDLEEGVTPVIVGEDGVPADAEVVESIGPFLVNKNDEPLIPEIKKGSYFFLDRHPDSPDPRSDEEILDRDSMHITLAVYDSEHHTLYYCAFDDTLDG